MEAQTPPPVVTPFYLDKALWVALLTPLSVFISRRFGVFLDVSEVVGVALSAVAYILGHKWAATQKSLAVYAGEKAKQQGSAINQ